LTKDLPLLSIDDKEFEKAGRYYLDKTGKRYDDEKSFMAAQSDIVDEKDRGGSMKWDDTKAEEKKIEFSLKTAKYLVEAVEKKSKAGELTLEDSKAVSLKTKLEA